ncbi:hypothetical protein [Ectothiorhodospira lacustris]|uniref:hypothetical protein n=1 Tax=Ectothiorhodospira lacustris TaxID=2899127 RepID=UPI001EE8701A|nr:hypothetical protein [Ectothiorhodospira lacustris]MCG5509617.1 hypothetical protein [Ectothiorhodospira lacustris]MCG5521588.1 hypothetical protein [Ectothiorhodospira lacustris]
MAGIPGKVLTRLLNGPWRPGAILLIEDPGFQGIWETLTGAPLLPDFKAANPEDVAAGILYAACVPASTFIDNRDWREFRGQAGSVARAAQKLREKLDAPFTGVLQTKADERTGFSCTGRLWRVNEFTKRLDEDLQFLIELCNLPEPARPRDHIQPTKAGAKRANATAKARLIKREMANCYQRPDKARWGMWKAVTDLVNITEQPEEPFTEDDARKA